MRQVGDRQETTMGVYVWDGQRDQFHPYTDADGNPLAFRYWRSKPGVFRYSHHFIRTQPADRNGMVPVSGRQTFRGTYPETAFRCVLDSMTGGLWHPDRLAEYDEIPEDELPEVIRREFAPWGPTVFPPFAVVDGVARPTVTTTLTPLAGPKTGNPRDGRHGVEGGRFERVTVAFP